MADAIKALKYCQREYVAENTPQFELQIQTIAILSRLDQ